MKIMQSHIATADLRQRRVFLRADLNVPLQNDLILNDYRLTAVLPTIDSIQKKGGKIILATHIGRPQGPTPALSTQVLIPWFVKKGYKIRFEPDLTRAIALSHELNNEIVLLENLRFFPGEQGHDATFAQQLFKLADYYVNDAFALLHRTDSSIALLPELFAPDKKTIGLLVEKELRALSRLRDNPAQPFVVVLGGGKVHDKLPLLRYLIGKARTILLCPAIVFTFLKAHGGAVGKSLVDTDSLHTVTEYEKDALEKNTRLVFPVDYQVALDTLDGPLKNVDASAIPENGIGMNIGTQTELLFAQEIKQAKTVFFNGLAGLWDKPGTLKGSQALINALSTSDAFTVIGGGDSVAAAQQWGRADKISYCSTGGGATLAYIAGERLPGLEALE